MPRVTRVLKERSHPKQNNIVESIRPHFRDSVQALLNRLLKLLNIILYTSSILVHIMLMI